MMLTRLCHSRVVHWVNIAFINASLSLRNLTVARNLLVIKLTKNHSFLSNKYLSQSNTSNFTNNKKHDEIGKTVR